MRWLLQILVMLSDFVLFGVALLAFIYLLFPLNIILVYVTYKVWKSQGGFIAWTHARQFLKNAKELGL
jgi:hypothetical protein